MAIQMTGQIGGATLVAEVLDIVAASNKAAAVQRSRTDAIRGLIASYKFPGVLRKQLRTWAVRSVLT